MAIESIDMIAIAKVENNGELCHCWLGYESN